MSKSIFDLSGLVALNLFVNLSFNPIDNYSCYAAYPECQQVAQCSSESQFRPILDQADQLLEISTNSSKDPQEQQQNLLQSLNMYLEAANTFCLDPGQTLDCRPGCARVFYRLAEIYRHSVGAKQRAHNLYQLAMSMFWDLSRIPQGLECMEAESQAIQQAAQQGQTITNNPAAIQQLPIGWSIDFNSFMDAYLSLAAEVHRHLPEGLPMAKKFHGSKITNGGYGVGSGYKKRKIAITSVCAYSEDHMLHELYPLIKQNRDRYVSVHETYDSHLWNTTFDAERAPVWSAVGLPLSFVQNEKYTDYDWILAADCDMQFVNMDIPLERVLDEYVNEEEDPDAKNIHLLITEDGRGLAGGIFFIRNSPEGRALVSSVYGDKNTVYNRHDLKDQWSFLWHLMRPKATASLKPMEIEQNEKNNSVKNTWEMLEYRDGVRLLPQRYLNSYPWVSCRPSHHCFDDPNDLVVSFISLSSFSKEMAFALLNKFLKQSVDSFTKLKSIYPDIETRYNRLISR